MEYIATVGSSYSLCGDGMGKILYTRIFSNNHIYNTQPSENSFNERTSHKEREVQVIQGRNYVSLA